MVVHLLGTAKCSPWITSLADQEPTALILVQVKLLDGYSFGPVAVRRFDRAEIRRGSA
jgi:hypothetical protein